MGRDYDGDARSVGIPLQNRVLEKNCFSYDSEQQNPRAGPSGLADLCTELHVRFRPSPIRVVEAIALNVR